MTETPGTSRRTLLAGGALGAAAVAFLAACGTKDDHPLGVSGVDPQPTAVPPTLPEKEAAALDLQWDITTLRTAASLELLAASLYGTYGPQITNADWKSEAARFRQDHVSASVVFNRNLTPSLRVTEPNTYIQDNSIDPIADQLTNDTAILNMFASLESSIAATYVTAVGTATNGELRGLFSGYGGASARRNALLANGGTGNPPTQPLYPTTDLISNDAYVQVDAPAADAGN